METLHVNLGDRSYPIYIGSGLLQQPELLTGAIRGHSAMLVSNTTVAPLYADQVIPSLQALKTAQVLLPDGEQYKTLEVLKNIFSALLEQHMDRSTTLVALGGGVVGDMTGFAAASYQRGVDFIQIPTTLLAMVDSSVGGKTGVNHPLGKNMIGAFYQPRCVIIDTKTLDTLDDKQLSAGIAEVIKYGIIIDADFFDWLEANMDALLARDKSALAYAIKRSCEIKADVVAADEKEKGQRALLNLGHTFGHAIETATGYGNWLHGEAVAAGMVMAANMAEQIGWMSKNEVGRIRQLLQHARLPVAPPESMTGEKFLDLMAVDKKVINGQLRLVIPRRIGHAVVTADFPADVLARVVS
ncbi:MAG TPA: 3-dehydroquinate synthase [Gammaproteobacteria bacterium]|nr:3-dehydroquinate synthase [Gammaproteobacteria bacterium]